MMSLNLSVQGCQFSLNFFHPLIKLRGPLEASIRYHLLVTVCFLKQMSIIELALIDLTDFIICEPLNALSILP